MVTPFTQTVRTFPFYFNFTMYILYSIYYLFIFQIIVQIIMIIVRAITKQKRNVLLKWGRDLMGFAENADEIGSGPHRLFFLWLSFFLAADNSLPMKAILSVISIALVLITRIFIILRIYTEGKGLGINFYFKYVIVN